VRVSDLKKGMMVRPKAGFVFRLYVGGNYGTVAPTDVYRQLECHKRRSPHKSLGTAPVIYLGKSPLMPPPRSSYESRQTVFVTTIGQKLRVAPEAWRNMEPITNE
jgi:hypothetical protein